MAEIESVCVCVRGREKEREREREREREKVNTGASIHIIFNNYTVIIIPQYLKKTPDAWPCPHVMQMKTHNVMVTYLCLKIPHD